MGQAASALVIGDGAVWIWRLADDRFPQARQRLDFYHAVRHQAAVGRAIHGEDKEKYRTWLKPLVRQLKNQSAIKVIDQLEAALAQMPGGTAAQAIAKEVACFHEHQARMDYRAGRRAGEPIGSGPVEATCRQTQCRFKRPGQFWSKRGDEALLCLEMFWRNGRWQILFPHTHLNHVRLCYLAYWLSARLGKEWRDKGEREEAPRLLRKLQTIRAGSLRLGTSPFPKS